VLDLDFDWDALLWMFCKTFGSSDRDTLARHCLVYISLAILTQTIDDQLLEDGAAQDGLG
jgi:hypothetical protein